MTAREVLWKELPHNSSVENENTIINKMKEYAKEKCQELLKIVAEKAETKELFVNGSDGGWYDKVGKVNKDSILNAVNLDEFIN